MMIPNILSIIIIYLASMHMKTDVNAIRVPRCLCSAFRDASFHLYTSPNVNESYNIRPYDRVFPPSMKRNSITIIFFQDDIDDAKSDAAMAIKNALITQYNVNFIVPYVDDWLTYTKCPCTKIPPPPTDEYTTRLIYKLRNQNLINFQLLHLIGWGTGAEVCSRVSQKLGTRRLPKIGRITGLDPIEKFHANVQSRSFLSKKDATFVDIIHTSTDGKGVKLPLGHADFYVNGGKSQPGCENTHCHHARAWMYFKESISKELKFAAVKCKKWQPSVSDCGVFNREYMGYTATPRSQGIYQVITKSTSPFNMDITELSASPNLKHTIDKDDEEVAPCDSESQEFPNAIDDIENDLPANDNVVEDKGHEPLEDPDHNAVKEVKEKEEEEEEEDEEEDDSSCENDIVETPVIGKLLPNEIAPAGYYSQDDSYISLYDFVDRPNFDAFLFDGVVPLGYFGL